MCGTPKKDDTRRNRPADGAPGSDDGAIPDRDTGKDGRSGPDQAARTHPDRPAQSDAGGNMTMGADGAIVIDAGQGVDDTIFAQ